MPAANIVLPTNPNAPSNLFGLLFLPLWHGVVASLQWRGQHPHATRHQRHLFLDYRNSAGLRLVPKNAPASQRGLFFNSHRRVYQDRDAHLFVQTRQVEKGAILPVNGFFGGQQRVGKQAADGH